MLKLGILIPPAASGAVWPSLQRTTEPGKPKPTFPATDSYCSTWFGKLSVNGELNVSKPGSLCQPNQAPLDGYQGSVVVLAIWPNYSGKWVGGYGD